MFGKNGNKARMVWDDEGSIDSDKKLFATKYDKQTDKN